MNTTLYILKQHLMDFKVVYLPQYIFHFVKIPSSGDLEILYLTVWGSIQGSNKIPKCTHHLLSVTNKHMAPPRVNILTESG